MYVSNVYTQTIIFTKKRRNEISQKLINCEYNKDHIESQLTKVDDTPWEKLLKYQSKKKKKQTLFHFFRHSSLLWIKHLNNDIKLKKIQII